MVVLIKSRVPPYKKRNSDTLSFAKAMFIQSSFYQLSSLKAALIYARKAKA